VATTCQDLAKSFSELAHAIREATKQRNQECATSQQLADVFHKLRQALASKEDLKQWKEEIMSAISTYTDAVNSAFAEIGTSVDEIVTSVAGVSGDVASLKDIILKLQNNPGPISAEDQALLDNGVIGVTALAERIKKVSSALKDLDAATESAPVPPA